MIVQRISLARWRKPWTGVGAIVAALLLVAWRFAPFGGNAAIPAVEVTQGNLALTLEEVGELRAKRSAIIAAPNDKLITYLAPEGSVVRAGDLLVQLESAKYVMGVDEGKSAVDVAQAQLDKAKADLQSQLYKEEAAKKQYESLLELQQKGFAMTSEVEEARLGYMELQSKTGAFRAAVDQERAEVTRAGKTLDQVKHRLASNAVYSPMDGIVVYASVGNPDEGKRVEVGFMPYEGQPLMELPDITSMQVLTEVNEMDVEKVKVGQPVEIRLDAVPDAMFQGKVARLGSLAQRKVSLVSGKRTAEKVFSLEVDVEAADPRLRPGLSATVSIRVAELVDVVYAPVEAIFQEQGRNIAYVKNGRRVKPVAVQCGSSNDRYVVIQAGLRPGDQVLLAPPI